MVDAAFNEVPSSTRNRAGARDPEMSRTKKDNQWHFGMKARIGVDAGTGLVHSLAETPAHVYDVTQERRLLHGGETATRCAVGYQVADRRTGDPRVGLWTRSGGMPCDSADTGRAGPSPHLNHARQDLRGLFKPSLGFQSGIRPGRKAGRCGA